MYLFIYLFFGCTLNITRQGPPGFIFMRGRHLSHKLTNSGQMRWIKTSIAWRFGELSLCQHIYNLQYNSFKELYFHSGIYLIIQRVLHYLRLPSFIYLLISYWQKDIPMIIYAFTHSFVPSLQFSGDLHRGGFCGHGFVVVDQISRFYTRLGFPLPSVSHNLLLFSWKLFKLIPKYKVWS